MAKVVLNLKGKRKVTRPARRCGAKPTALYCCLSSVLSKYLLNFG